MAGQPKYNTALYLRLSKDDGTMSESSSIQTQKEMLTRYCRENGFAISQIYIGICSRTNQNEDSNLVVSGYPATWLLTIPFFVLLSLKGYESILYGNYKMKNRL